MKTRCPALPLLDSPICKLPCPTKAEFIDRNAPRIGGWCASSVRLETCEVAK